jgi:hypothetical protein
MVLAIHTDRKLLRAAIWYGYCVAKATVRNAESAVARMLDDVIAALRDTGDVTLTPPTTNETRYSSFRLRRQGMVAMVMRVPWTLPTNKVSWYWTVMAPANVSAVATSTAEKPQRGSKATGSVMAQMSRHDVEAVVWTVNVKLRIVQLPTRTARYCRFWGQE